MNAARAGVFGLVPAGARLTYVWATPIVMLGMLAASQVLPIVVAVPIAGAIIASGVKIPPAVLFCLFVVGIAAIFALFAGAGVFWIKVFERRSLASAGWRGPNRAGRYLRGWGIGFAIGAVFLILQYLLDRESGPLLVSGLAELVSSPAGFLVLGLFAIMFAIQSGAEEFVFRGWMMSAIAARRGVTPAVLISGFAFGIAHIHYAFISPLAGVLAMLGVGFIGVAFAFYALREGSVTGACAAHAAYNYSLVTATIALSMGREEGVQNPLTGSIEAFIEATQLTEYDPTLLAGALAAGIVALIFWFAARGRHYLSEDQP